MLFYSTSADETARALVRIENDKKEVVSKAKAARQNLLLRISLAGFAVFLILAFLLRRAFLAVRKNRFPETQWSPRLEAPHSGGSSLNQNPPSTQPRDSLLYSSAFSWRPATRRTPMKMANTPYWRVSFFAPKVGETFIYDETREFLTPDPS